MKLKLSMRTRITFTFLMSAVCFAYAQTNEFVNPVDFDGSAKQKQQVIRYIQQHTYNSACKRNNICSPAMLRTLEETNLDAFKRLTQAEDRDELRNTVRSTCFEMKMCDYFSIETIYNENVKSKKRQLAW